MPFFIYYADAIFFFYYFFVILDAVAIMMPRLFDADIIITFSLLFSFYAMIAAADIFDYAVAFRRRYCQLFARCLYAARCC